MQADDPDHRSRLCFLLQDDHRGVVRPRRGDHVVGVDNFITSELPAVTGNVLIVTHLLPALCFRRRLEGWSDQSVLRHYEDCGLANGDFLLYRKGRGRRLWHLCAKP